MIVNKTYTLTASMFSLLLCFFMELSGNVYCRESYPSNVTLLSRTVKQLAMRIMAEKVIGQVPIYFDLPAESGDTDAYIFNRFIEEWIAAGHEIHISPDSLASGAVFCCQKPYWMLSYNRIMHGRFWGKGMVTRSFHIRLSLQILLVPGSRVLDSRIWEDTIADTIPVSSIPDIEEEGYLLGHPELPKDTGFRKWVEPVFVLLTVCGIGYLFYTVRSQ